VLPRQNAVPCRHVLISCVCVCVYVSAGVLRRSANHCGGERLKTAGNGVLHQAGHGAAQAVRSPAVLARGTMFRQECSSSLC